MLGAVQLTVDCDRVEARWPALRSVIPCRRSVCHWVVGAVDSTVLARADGGSNHLDSADQGAPLMSIPSRSSIRPLRLLSMPSRTRWQRGGPQVVVGATLSVSASHRRHRRGRCDRRPFRRSRCPYHRAARAPELVVVVIAVAVDLRVSVTVVIVAVGSFIDHAIAVVVLAVEDLRSVRVDPGSSSSVHLR